MIYQLIIAFIIALAAMVPGVSQAKGGDEQNQIILLNDSASALEDSDPDLSKGLAKLADAKEKEWEDSSANKTVLPVPITDKDIPQLKEQIKLLRAAALAMKPVYPLMAKSLNAMANGIDRRIEVEK